MIARQRSAAALAAMILLASAVLLGSRVLTDDDPVTLPSVPLAIEEEVVATASPPAAPARPVNRQYATSKECPEMDNPGGLRWDPSSNAGPFPTDGSIVMPTLDVSAPIVKVGVGSDGAMVVPHNARDVAWLDQGGIPGDTNNVVLAGHINYSRQAGSFGRIRELGKGDSITVEMKGRHYKFRVVWNCFFDRNTDAAAQIMGKTDVPSVTLISCGGVFDSSARTHTQRVAVRAEMYSPGPDATEAPAAKSARTPSPSPGGGLLDGLRR